jgi:hypothetical protein
MFPFELISKERTVREILLLGIPLILEATVLIISVTLRFNERPELIASYLPLVVAHLLVLTSHYLLFFNGERDIKRHLILVSLFFAVFIIEQVIVIFLLFMEHISFTDPFFYLFSITLLGSLLVTLLTNYRNWYKMVLVNGELKRPPVVSLALTEWINCLFLIIFTFILLLWL